MNTERVTALVPVEMLEAHIQEHRVVEAKLTMRLIQYRELLEKHGIEPPDSGEDELLAMWQDCRAVVSTASEFVARLGPARELLAGSWKPSAA